MNDVFVCQLGDVDLVRACAPEQPSEVRVEQEWMRLSDGLALPVRRIRPPYVDLGTGSYTVITTEADLRRDWVCIDPPRPVTALPEPEFPLAAQPGEEQA
jgi:hypothetical protein